MAYTDTEHNECGQAQTPTTKEAKGIGYLDDTAARREFVLRELFTYHPPNPHQQKQYEAIRAAAKYFAEVVLTNTPVSSDQSTAIRKIREAVMTANAAVALNGVSF
jgi:hypothetical protein